MKKQNIITYIVLFWLFYGLYRMDPDNLSSIQSNWIAYSGIAVFIAYFIYSLKVASAKQAAAKK